jgi:hypothetical protein
MDQDIKNKLDEQAAKIDAIFISVEKSRKYFLVTMWITVLAIVLPMIGIAIMGPSFVNSYSQALEATQQ